MARSLSPVQPLAGELEDCDHADVLEVHDEPFLRALHVNLGSDDYGQLRSTMGRRALALCMACAAAVAVVATSRDPRAGHQATANSHLTVGLEEGGHQGGHHDPEEWGRWSIYIRGAGGLCLDSYDFVHMEVCNADRMSQQWLRNPSTGQIRNRNGTCLDTAHPHEDGGEVHMWPCDSGNEHQSWHVDVDENSIGGIKSSEGMCLISTGEILSTVQLGECGKDQRQETWGLGGITWTLGTIEGQTDTPSLFCWQVVNASADSYEIDITRETFKRNSGVFGCNAWVLFSEEKSWIQEGVVQTSALPGDPKPFRRAWSQGIHWIMNSDTFIRAWNKIRVDGRYLQHDWVVKVDPDAAFWAGRLRKRFEPKTNRWTGAVFVKNCAPFDSMQGPMEVISQEAMTKLTDGVDVCRTYTDILLGEDYFLQHCLERLGVGSMNDFQMLHDRYCGPPQGAQWRAMQCGLHRDSVGVHPLKTTWEYLDCLAEVDPSTKVVQPPIL